MRKTIDAMKQALAALTPFEQDALGIHPDWSPERRRASLTQKNPINVGDYRKAVESAANLREAITREEAQTVESVRFAKVPLTPSAAMNAVMEQDDWEWRDVLAAADAITEEQYNAPPLSGEREELISALNEYKEDQWWMLELSSGELSNDKKRALAVVRGLMKLAKTSADMLAADAQDEKFATDMLALMFDKYENGTACYEDPEDCTGSLGNAIQLDHADFHRIADFLNKKRPVAVANVIAQQVAVPQALHLVGYYHKADTAGECDFYFLDAVNGDCPDCHPCYADTAALEKPPQAGRTNAGDETGGTVKRFGFDMTGSKPEIIPATNGAYVWYADYLVLWKTTNAAPQTPQGDEA